MRQANIIYKKKYCALDYVPVLKICIWSPFLCLTLSGCLSLWPGEHFANVSTAPTSFLFHYMSAVDVLHSLQPRHFRPSLLPFETIRDWQWRKHTHTHPCPHAHTTLREEMRFLTKMRPIKVSSAAGVKRLKRCLVQEL